MFFIILQWNPIEMGFQFILREMAFMQTQKKKIIITIY